MPKSITEDTGCCSVNPSTYACSSLHDAFQYYYQLTNKTWLSCVEFLLKSSQSLDRLEGTGILGIGEPNIERGSHVHVKFSLNVSSLHRKQSLTLALQSISFRHVEVDIENLAVEINNCTLNDSSLRMNSDLLSGNNVTILNSTWEDILNTTALEVVKMDSVYINNTHIRNTIFKYSHHGFWEVVTFKHISILAISNMTINNTSQIGNINITETMKSTSDTPHNKVVRKTNDVLEHDNSVIKIQHSDYVVVAFVSIDNTRGGGALALYNVSNCEIQSSNFTRNENQLMIEIRQGGLSEVWVYSRPGGAILSLMSKVSVHNCVFHSNYGGDGGGIWASCLKQCKPTVTYVKDSFFWNNTGRGNGGAILTTHNLTIIGSNFIENIAPKGGAVRMIGSSTEETYLQVQNVLFYNNVAREGGSLMAEYSSIYMHNINITLDQTLWNDLHIPDYVMSGHQVYILLGALNASLLHIDIQALGPHAMTFTFIIQFIPAIGNYEPVILNNYSLKCPDGFIFSPGFPSDEITCNYIIGNPFCIITDDYHPSCTRGPPNMYLSERDGYSITDPGNGSEPIQHYVNSTPKSCPVPGGNCSFGCPTNEECNMTLRPLPGYWGQFISGIAHFLQCPAEYCCWGPDCRRIGSCNEEYKRTGVLCSQCPTNYTVALFSEKCIDIENCNQIWPIFATIILVIICVTISILLGIPEKTSTLHALMIQINKRTHGNSGVNSHICQMQNPPSKPQTSNNGAAATRSDAQLLGEGPSNAEVMQNSNETIQVHENINVHHGNDDRASEGMDIDILEENESTESENSQETTANEHTEQCTSSGNLNENNASSIANMFLQCILTVSFYIQDVTLYYSHLIDYVKGDPGWLQSLSTTIPFIRKIINFHADIMSAIDKHTCMFPGMSPSEKLVLKTSVYPLSMLIFGLLFLSIFVLVPACSARLRCCAWLKRKITNDKIKTSLSTGFLICVSLSYQQITATALNLVKCVDVYYQSQKSMILALWLDATVKCYTAWQKCVVCVFVLYCFSLPFYFIFAPGKLQSKGIGSKTFILGLLVPGLFLAWWFLAFIFGKIRCLRSLKRKIGHYAGHVPYLGNIFRKPGYIDLDAPRFSPIRDAILGHVCVSYKASCEGRVNWSGIIQLLRLILVICSVLLQNQWERIILMWTVSLISLSIHAHFKPLKSRAMNFLAFLCQVAIVFVGGLYIYLASLEDAQASPVQNYGRISTVYAVISIFSVIIPMVCIWLIILCGLITAIKWMVRKCRACFTDNDNQHKPESNSQTAGIETTCHF